MAAPAPAPRWLANASLPAAALAIPVLVYAVNWNPLMANLTLNRAIALAATDVNRSIGLFQEALAYDSFGNQEIREQLMQYAMNLHAGSVPDSTKQQILAMVRSEMKKMIDQAPNDVRHRLFLGMVLDTYGVLPEAEGQLKKALELSPRKQTTIFQLASHYLRRGDRAKAFEYYKRAYDLEPGYADARLGYIIAAIYAGNYVIADWLLGSDIIIDDRLLRAYLDTQQFGKAIDMAKAKAAHFKNDANVRLGLADVYRQAGQAENAMGVVRQVIADNPQFKDRGEAIIKEIQAGR